MKSVIGKFGRIDVLVNNAGGSPALASALEADERLWDKVMDLNLKGLFFLSQAVARVMKDAGGGKIINVSPIDCVQARSSDRDIRHKQSCRRHGYEGDGQGMGHNTTSE